MLRMMIVDDEARIADAIYDLMDEHFELELYRCYSAQDALKTIAAMRFDIVITDVSMPGMSGLELLSRTQAIWPKCHFLILTAYDSFSYAYETLRHDRVDYLLKLESYDTICACVEKKLRAITTEREKEEQLQYYGSYKQQVEASMCHYFLKRMILQGIPLPDQRDLDQFSVPIRLDAPVVLALLAMSDQNPLTNSRSSVDLQETLLTQLRTYGLRCLSYLSTGDMATYARTVLEALPQSVENATELHLAILCADAPVNWAQAHTLYQYAAVRLEKLRNDSGLALLDTADALRSAPQELAFPSMEELSMLWEMVKCGNIDAFRQVFLEHVQGIDTPAALPPHVRAAVSYLILEASRLYGEGDPAAYDALLKDKEYASLRDWVDALAEERVTKNAHTYFFPYLAGTNELGGTGRACGAFAGLSLDSDRYDMALTVMEGVAFEAAMALDSFRQGGGRRSGGDRGGGAGLVPGLCPGSGRVRDGAAHGTGSAMAGTLPGEAGALSGANPPGPGLPARRGKGIRGPRLGAW